MVKLLGNLALIAATSGFVSFVVLYHVLASWRDTRMGRHVMVFMLVCSAILVYITIFSLVPLSAPPRAIVRLAVYGSLASIGWWRVVLLLKEQRAASVEPTISGKHRNLNKEETDG